MPVKFFVLCALFAAVFAAEANSADYSYRITKTQWSAVDEKNWQNFVASIGAAVERGECRTVDQCFKLNANTYRHSDPTNFTYRADCADFPFFMRGYFAWKNGLPFGFAMQMRPRQIAGNTVKDIRYSRYGNEVVKRYGATTNSRGKYPDGLYLLRELIPSYTFSANYRTIYSFDQGVTFSDFYPLKVTRDGIRPGTVLYDPDGHVVLIYKVGDDGRVYYIDAHPDNSLTKGVFGKKFVRAHPGQGAGFKNWRPLILTGASKGPNGTLIGGQILTLPNESLPDYSVEQFYGLESGNREWTKARFAVGGNKVDYYDYIRFRLGRGNLKIQPVHEFRNLVKDLCVSLKDRVLAVDIAIAAGIQNRPHPGNLPENIYGTSGDWETYSTPSRDAQLKVVYKDLIDQAANFFTRIKARDPMIDYAGNNLAGELLDVYLREARSCEFQYVNSAGRSVSLNLEDVRQRLFKLSFDPYHCVELRWGATTRDELATCRDDAQKRQWYAREQPLRNQHLRRYDIPSVENGAAQPPNVDVITYLKSRAGAGSQ